MLFVPVSWWLYFEVETVEFALLFSAVSRCCVWQERMQMNNGDVSDEEKRNSEQQEGYWFNSESPNFDMCSITHVLSPSACVGVRVYLAYWRK